MYIFNEIYFISHSLTGHVLSLVRGKAGTKSAVYKVLHNNDDSEDEEIGQVDHIVALLNDNICLYICNELGGGGTTASVDQVHTKNNRHTPVMVYDDLMINKHSVVDYNTNRPRPMTFL